MEMVYLAQPTKLNPYTANALLAALANGANMSGACAYIGVSPRTIRDWQTRAAAALEAYPGGRDAAAETVQNRARDKDGKVLSYAALVASRPRHFPAGEWPYVVLSALSVMARGGAIVTAETGVFQAGKAGDWRAYQAWLKAHSVEGWNQPKQLQIETAEPVKVDPIQLWTNKAAEREFAITVAHMTPEAQAAWAGYYTPLEELENEE